MQGLNGILADEMGLGKTIQAMSFLAHLAQVRSTTSRQSLVNLASCDWHSLLDCVYSADNVHLGMQCSMLVCHVEEPTSAAS